MPSVRSSTTQTHSGTNMTVTAPAGIVDGDYLSVCISMSSANDIASVPSGWTDVFGKLNNGGQFVYIYEKIASSEGASWTWTINFSNSTHAHAIAVQDVDTTSPRNAQGAQNNGSSTNIVAPTITTSVDNCLLLGWFCHNNGNLTTPDGAMTEQTDTAYTARTIEGAYQSLGTAGATGTRTATFTTSATSTGALIAVAPPAAGGRSMLLAFP